MKQEA